MTVGSLFSGIGGLDFGFERAGFTIRWQCEADEFCRRALRKHWPDVPCHPDIRELTAATVEPVDVLIGGFPCQDVSDAGLRTGIDGARSGLWAEYARLIREFRAHGLRAVAIENVTGLFARGMDRVLGDLAALGMDAEWEVIYERPTSALRIDAPESSSWLTPNCTPEATSNNGSNAGRPATGKSLAKQARGDWPTPNTCDANSAARHTTTTGVMHPGTTLTDAIRLWPTPIAEDSESRTSHGTLLDATRGEMWQTPLASDANGTRRYDGKRGVGLNSQTQPDWRTPNQRDWKGPSAQSWRDRETGDPTPTLPDQLSAIRDSGPLDPENRSTHGNRPVVLNPAWVGALMGFPVDWLDGVAPPSKRSATPSSRKSPKS